MTLRIYDSRAQALRDFVPCDPENVTLYVCGPTVQSGPHIGHVRAALSFDVLRRWLMHRYRRVTFVRNVTDIDDKTLANATPAEPWWALAYRVEQEFAAAYAAVGVLAPTVEPRATGHIPQMITLIEQLIDAGHAYAAADGVYFDVRSWPDYGSLTRQSVDSLEPAVENPGESTGTKLDPHDFALWKLHKDGEPADAAWDSPWGRGRPGWHIECSAMARHYLGAAFDIHGGGLDLRFPHHENELAQSTAAGDEFAAYWVHNGLVTVNGQKMAKSLGNFTLAADVLAAHPARVVRYGLIAAHYRSNLDLSPTSWSEAQAALGRIDSFLERGARVFAADTSADAVTDTVALAIDLGAFARAMDDDLNTPQALAAVHEEVRRGNTALDSSDTAAARSSWLLVKQAMGVLGLASDEYHDQAGSDNSQTTALNGLMAALIDQRAQARNNKDWTAADQVRNVLGAAGITLEDTPDGTNWSING